jgi:hypothetical protein
VIRSGIPVLARIVVFAVAAVLLGSCGSGAVGNPPVNDPTKITILPDNATLYSGLPTTFSITGGTGAYIVSSSNQAVVPVATTFVGTSLTVIPNPVLTDTLVTLTARDTGTTAPATVTMTVKPGTVSNTITLTPSSSACSPAVCSGGDAVISVVISQGGIPLAARGVRFEVISGDVAFITSPAGQPETLALKVETATDETGTARARLRAGAAATNQTAIVQVTDLGSGAYQRTTVIVALATPTQAAFFTIPTSITFTGPNNQTCASSGSVASEIFVFGGSPPYTISNSASGAFSTNTNVIGSSGGSVRVTPTGVCADNAVIGFTDRAGRTITVTLSNQLGTVAPPTPAMVVSPSSVTLNSCAATGNVNVGGGSGHYVASSGSSNVVATVSSTSPAVLTVSRANNTGPTASPVVVTVSDGVTSQTVNVNLTGNASGSCPTPMTASPAGVTFTGCDVPKNVTLSGGSGTYTASSSSPSVTTSVVGTTLTLTRANPSAAGSATITFRDASDPAAQGTVPVTLSGTCP